MNKFIAPAVAGVVLGCASIPFAMDAAAAGFNPMNMMNPSKWMGGKDRDRYDDDYYYDRRYGGPYGGYGGPYGYGGGPWGYGAPYGGGWGGYPGYGYGGYPAYGYGAPQVPQQQQQAPTPPPIQ